MDRIRVTGGKPLHGTIQISGAKNAALPLMAACLLTKDEVVLENMPYLSDIITMANLLTHHGVEMTMDGLGDVEETTRRGRTMRLSAADITDLTAPYEIVRKMRASVVVLGPLLARFGHCRVSLPGGCAIGTRPIDYHLNALKELGAEIALEEGYVIAKAPKGLHSADITFPEVSVGATENLLMAATLAHGTTILNRAAAEPEVSDLADLLNKMGAHIEGIGTHTLVIHGVGSLHGAVHPVIPDRIEAGTYMAAAGITGGRLRLTGVNLKHMGATVDAFTESGIVIQESGPNAVEVFRANGRLKSLGLTTAPYPDFATDMQAQFVALLALADGESGVTETIFENRFMHVPELVRMGADLLVNGRHLRIRGVEKLSAAEVMATDLRASVSLVLAALAAPGTSLINRVYHIDRGYERVEEKLAACGAQIERISKE